MVSKMVDGERLVRTLPTTPLQIFCKIILNSKFIVKGIEDPDDNSCRAFHSGIWRIPVEGVGKTKFIPCLTDPADSIFGN